MAATTLCCMVLVLPTVLEARKPSRRTARIRRERREVLIYADNRTANEALFRFAVVGDNHYWQSTSRRAEAARLRRSTDRSRRSASLPPTRAPPGAESPWA